MANDINITPDMINNLVNMLKNNENSENNATSNENSSTSINPEDILSKFSQSKDDSNNSSSLDFDTILKIKSIMEALNNKNDPRSNLLYSLKPYLRKSKQAKLDQYVNIMKISQVTNLFKNEKGEKD